MDRKWTLKSWTGGLACGVVAGLAIAVLVAAETEKPADGGKYQLHVWAHQGGAPGDIGKHGAYRLDPQTGEVWVINARDEAHKLEFKEANRAP